MLLRKTNLKYVKLNRVRLNAVSQTKITEIFKEFFEDINGTIKGLKGYAIFENWFSY